MFSFFVSLASCFEKMFLVSACVILHIRCHRRRHHHRLSLARILRGVFQSLLFYLSCRVCHMNDLAYHRSNAPAFCHRPSARPCHRPCHRPFAGFCPCPCLGPYLDLDLCPGLGLCPGLYPGIFLCPCLDLGLCPGLCLDLGLYTGLGLGPCPGLCLCLGLGCCSLFAADLSIDYDRLNRVDARCVS